jgi:aminotransferase
VIREMSRLCAASGGVNLAQGFPDFACPQELKDAAKQAVDGDVNQYAITWGAKAFRDGIAAKVARTYPGWDVDPETQLCVTCGSTEAMIATLLATVDPGDEVLVFQPFYENYGPDAVLSGATPRYVQLHQPDWSIDEAELRAAFSDRTRAIIVNTPHNPTGKVFSREELALISELCQTYDVCASPTRSTSTSTTSATAGTCRRPPCRARGPHGHRQRAEQDLRRHRLAGGLDGRAAAHHRGIRKVHDFLTVGAAAPCRRRGRCRWRCPVVLRRHRGGLPRAARRAVRGAARGGLPFRVPDGAYYVLCDTSALDADRDSSAYARRIVVDPGVAPCRHELLRRPR